MIKLWDGTCRGNDSGKIVDFLRKYGPMEVADICKKMNRCTRYVCSLVEESEVLHYTREKGDNDPPIRHKRDYVVWYDENCI